MMSRGGLTQPFIFIALICKTPMSVHFLINLQLDIFLVRCLKRCAAETPGSMQIGKATGRHMLLVPFPFHLQPDISLIKGLSSTSPRGFPINLQQIS